MTDIRTEAEQFRRFRANHSLTTRTIHGVDWEYIICGQGEPLLLLPGALATAETSFQYILAFEDQYRVIAPTYPAAITRVAPLIDGLAGLVRAEKCAPAHVLGGSYSGMIAQSLVRRHPDVVASLMLTNTGIPRPMRAHMTTVVLAGLAALPIRLLRHFFKRLIRSFLPDSTPAQDFWRSYFVDLINSLSRDDYLSRIQVAIDFDLHQRFRRDDLRAWKRPILLVEADNDHIFTPHERISLRHLYPKAMLRIQSASSHTASLDQSDETIALMRSFLTTPSVSPRNASLQIAIIALGSRGDVQPFIALGLRLQARGHHVRILAITDYAELVRSYGLDYWPLVGSAAELMDRELVYGLLEGASNPLLVGYRFLQSVGPLIHKLVADCWAGCRDADGLVVSTLGQYVAESIAERLGIPMALAHFHPNSRTRFWPDKSFPQLPPTVPWRPLYNLITYPLAEHGLWQLLRPALNTARQELLDLPSLGPITLWQRVRTLDRPIVYGYSQLVAPPPPDWDGNATITGYWFADQPPGWQPPAELEAFLRAGPRPIYVGFGSTLVGRYPDLVTALIVEALRRTGQRGILFRGWGDLGNIQLPPEVLLVDAVPHDWLFRHVAAAVHHGGAGTTAAALRAGIPSVVIPALGDMTYWGARVAALGVGPAPLIRADLTADRLAEAISRATSDNLIGKRATDLGQQLFAEDGAHRAAEAIERILT